MKPSIASVKKWIARILVVKYHLLLMAAALVILLLLYVQSSDFERRLSSFIVKEIEARFERRAALEGVGFSFFPLEVVVKKLQISDEEGSFVHPFLSSGECRIKLRLNQLLRKNLDVREIALLRPVINLKFDEQGKLQFPLPKMGERSGKPALSTSISFISLKDGFIGLDNLRIPLDLQLSHFKISLNKDRMDRYHGKVSFSDSFVQYKNYARTDLLLVDLSFLYEEDNLSFSKIQIRNPGIDTELEGTVNLGTPVTYLFDIHSSMEVENVKNIFNVSQTFTGQMDYRGRIEGVGKEYELTGDYEGHTKLFDRIQVHDLTGKVLYTPREITFYDMKCDSLGGQVAGSFTTFKQEGRRFLKAGFDFQSVDLSQALDETRVKGFRFAGTASGQGGFMWEKGKLLDLTGDGSLRVSPPEATADIPKGAIPLDASLDFTMQDREVHFEDSRILFQYTNVFFDGALGLDHGSALNVKTDTSALTEVDRFIRQIRRFRSKEKGRQIDLLGMHGRVDFVGTYFGPVKKPGVRGFFRGEDIVYADSRWGSVKGNLVLDQGFLTFKDTDVILPDGTIGVEGMFKVYHRDQYSANQIDATFHIQNYPAPGLFRIFRQEIPLDGNVSGMARLEGQYGALKGEAKIHVSQGRFHVLPFNRLETEVSFIPPRIVFTDSMADLADGTVMAAGEVNYVSKTLSFDCTGKNLEIGTLPFAQRLKMTGQASFSGSITGKIRRPDVMIDAFRVDRLIIAEESLPALEGAGSLRDTEGQYSLAFADESLTGTGTVEVRENIPVRGNILLKKSNLSPVVKALTGLSALEENLSGKIEYRIPVLEPDKVHIRANLEELRTSVADYSLLNSEPLDMEFKNGVLYLGKTSYSGEDSLFSVEGTIDFKENARLALKLYGDVNLSLLKLFSPSITSRGRLSLDAELSGFFNEPILSGTADLEDGYFSDLRFPQPLRDIRAKMKLTTRQIEVEEAQCDLGGGTITASGKWLVSGNKPNSFDFDIYCSKVKLQYPADSTSVFDADCSLQGNLDEQLLRGTVKVDKLNYNAEFSSASLLGNGEGRQEEMATVNKFKNNFKFNLEIEADDGLMVNNNLADLELFGNLTLQGTLQKPLLFGQAGVIGGKIFFRNQEYRVRKGNIDFQDPRRINPVLDIAATALIDNTYEITLTFYGPLDKLHFDYSSNPPLPEVDIINLLATGRIREGREGVQDLATVGVSSFLTDQFLGDVTQKAADLFGFDRLSITPALVGEQTEPSAWLTVRKRLPYNISLTWSYNFSNVVESIIIVDYELTDNVLLVGTRDQDGSSSLDINYRLNY